MLKSVSEWLTHADKLNNYYIRPTPTRSTIPNFIHVHRKRTKYEVLYSPNGKYKLTLKTNSELKYAVNGDAYKSTDNDGSIHAPSRLTKNRKRI
jgi:hypothetical protein